MTNYLLLAAAAVSFATPVLAAEPKTADAPSVANPAIGTAARSAARGPRYCVVETTTGSHIATKTCRTRGEWLRDGIDPLAK